MTIQHEHPAAEEANGKPRKSAMVSVRLSDLEFQAVQKQAKLEGISVSAYLRNLATHGAVVVQSPAVARPAHASSGRPRRPMLAVFSGYGSKSVVTGS